MTVSTFKFPSFPGFPWIGDQFVRMLALSLFLHAVAFLPFLSPRSGSFNKATVAYLDLNLEMAGKKVTAKPVPAEKVETPAHLPSPPVKPLSELDKLRDNTRKTLSGATSQPETLQEASLGLSMTNGYFTSIGEGETLRDDIREYYFEMLRRINEKWWLNKESREKGGKSAVFYLVIARNGKIVDSMLVESSGNPLCDREMLHVLEAASPLPPLPETFRGDYFQAPLRFNMPLNLLG